MVLEQEDFRIDWPNRKFKDIGKTDSLDEISEAMNKVRGLVAKSNDSEVISIELRTSVAEAVASGINNSGSGFAAIDIDPKSGGYSSFLYVAQTAVIRYI